jgi:predicted nuclease with TOPRIM domain
MNPWGARVIWISLTVWFLAWSPDAIHAGVSRVIQERYRNAYENKALFLKIPVFTERQFVSITGQTFRHEFDRAGGAPRFKVGDQVRVLGIDFGGEDIRFKLGAIADPAVVELDYRFDAPLLENFPNSAVFDKALAATFTEGLKFIDLEEAKRAFVEQEFDRVSREIATTSGTNRETVLKIVAPQLPAFQDARQEIETLHSRIQDLNRQASQAQAENRKLDSETKTQQAEIGRLRTQAAGLQEKLDGYTSQMQKLGDDLRNARGTSQSYQRELANLQRSLKVRVDPSRDLPAQIAELGQFMQKIQRDNETLQGENGTLRSGLEKARADNEKLTGENQDLSTSIRQKEETIRTLTSREDSLARQYFLLKQAKEHLENVTTSIANLSTRLIEEKTEGGMQHGKTSVYLGNVLLGAFEWRLPDRLNVNQETLGEASFSRESIDYVKLTALERQVLQSLGERFKLRVNLASRSDSLEVKLERESAVQEVAERDRAVWRWRIVNRGAQDSRVVVAAQLVNRNGDSIPLIQKEGRVDSSNLVRQLRDYVQPVPIVLGVVLGALLACITGVFSRVRRGGKAREGTHPEPQVAARKQL